MKKLLLVAILMLALVLTVAACKTDPATTETTAGETTVADPVDSTAAPDDTTAAPEETTAAPEETTEATEVTTEEVTTEEVTTEAVTADPMEPVNVFKADDIKTLTGMNGVTSAEVVDGVLHVVPETADPYWYPFAGVDGARYVVVRYRTADATGADIQFYIGSTGTAPADDSSMLRQPAIVDGEWHLAIFDTQSLIDAGIYNGSYVSYFRFDPLEAGYILDENGQPQKPDGQNYLRYELPAGCSIDVDYIAFFHSVEAAEAYDCAPALIVGADTLAEKAATGNVMAAELKDGFVRLTTTGADPFFQFINGAGTMPKYLAVSYRTNSNSNGEFFIGSGAGPAGGSDELKVDWVGDGKWNLLVVDVTTVEGLTSITDGNINYCRMDFFTDAGAEGDYFDVSYVGFFESEADAKAYYAINGLQLKDHKDPFTSDISSNFADAQDDVNLKNSDIANLFDQINYGAGADMFASYNNGEPFYGVSSFTSMHTKPTGKYAFNINVTATGGAEGFAGFFVRGYQNASNEKQFFGTDGNDDGGVSHGGAGIYLNYIVKDEVPTLRLNVKTYVEGAYVPNIYYIPVDSSNFTVADDGYTVYIIAGDKLVATVVISGTADYSLEAVPADALASKVVLTLCDGTVAELDNACVAASVLDSDLGVATRTGTINFNSVSLTAFSAVEIPSFPEAASNEIAVEITDNNCWVDVVEFTATATGNYTFNLPAGMGAWDVDKCDNEPWSSAPYVDYYENESGASFTIGLTEGDTTTFYIAHATKGEYVITFEFAEGEVGGDEDGDDPVAPAETILAVGENTIVVTDAIIAEGGVAYTLTVTEAGDYQFNGDFMVNILDANGTMVGRGMASLEAGEYTIQLGTMMISAAGEYPLTVVYTAPAAE